MRRYTTKMTIEQISRRRFGIGIATASIALVSGCIGEDDHDDHSHEHGRVSDLTIIDRSVDEIVADYHGHWHGTLPSIPLGEHVSLGATFEDDDGNVLPLGEHEEYQFGAVVADGANDEPINIVLHGDHVHLQGEATGVTAVAFQLLHDGEVEWEASESIGVEVVEE